MHTVRAVAVLSLFLLVASGAPASAEGNSGFETLTPSAHPFLKGLGEAPSETRLWAQFSDQEGFFTTAQGQLPGAYTPSDPMMSTGIALRVFDALDVVETGGARLYHAAPAAALWESGFDDVPLKVSWQLSASARDLDGVNAVAPRLSVTTSLLAERADGRVPIGSGQSTVDLLAAGGEKKRVDIELGRAQDQIQAGDRLVVELDWRWFDALDGRPVVRPPLVSVHPGSWLDLPILEPLRILSFDERHVLGELYVRAEVAHLFAVRNIDFDSTALSIHGPGANAVAGSPLVQPLDLDEDVAHRASFDWVVPMYGASEGGAHRIWMTVRQVNDPAPRLVASRVLTLGESDVDVAAGTTPSSALLLSLVVPAAIVSVPFVHRRRP